MFLFLGFTHTFGKFGLVQYIWSWYIAPSWKHAILYNLHVTVAWEKYDNAGDFLWKIAYSER